MLCKKWFHDQMETAKYMSLVTDAYTDVTNSNLANFVFTTPAPVLYAIVKLGSEKHDAEHAASIVGKIIEEQPESHKIVAVVTDNEENVGAARDPVPLDYMPWLLVSWPQPPHQRHHREYSVGE
jgi:Protein of unknown function (DUF 659)